MNKFKYILFFTTFWDTAPNLPVGPTLFEQCPVTNCFITHNKHELPSISQFDAVIFHMVDIELLEQEELPDQMHRSPKQRYVMLIAESPQHWKGSLWLAMLSLHWPPFTQVMPYFLWLIRIIEHLTKFTIGWQQVWPNLVKFFPPKIGQIFSVIIHQFFKVWCQMRWIWVAASIYNWVRWCYRGIVCLSHHHRYNVHFEPLKQLLCCIVITKWIFKCKVKHVIVFHNFIASQITRTFGRA